MSRRVHSDADDFADDIIWGVKGPRGLAKFLKKTPEELYPIVKKLPHKKHGHRMITFSKGEIRRYFQSKQT